jgi:hypothetical protein
LGKEDRDELERMGKIFGQKLDYFSKKNPSEVLFIVGCSILMTVLIFIQKWGTGPGGKFGLWFSDNLNNIRGACYQADCKLTNSQPEAIQSIVKQSCHDSGVTPRIMKNIA